MNTKFKILKLFIAMSFLINIVLNSFVYAYSYDTRDKLSPASSQNELAGIQHKDISRIKIGLQSVLKSLDLKNGKADTAAIKKALENMKRKEDTIYHPSEVQFFIHETQETQGGDVCIMARVTDHKDKGGKTRTYYALYDPEAEDDGYFPINKIYTEEEYEAETLPERQQQDIDAIKRDLAHQKYDREVIEWMHDNKWDSIKELEGTNFSGGIISQILYIAAIKLDEEDRERLLNKKIYLYKRDDEIDSRIDENLLYIKDSDGVIHTVKGYMHSSNEAMHLFIPEWLYNSLEPPGGMSSGQQHAEIAYSDAKARLFGRIAYEIGVAFGGIPNGFRESKHGEMYPHRSSIVNLIKEYPECAELQKGEKYPVNEVYERYCANCKRGPDEYGEKEFKLVDLDKNLLTRDFAGGSEEPADIHGKVKEIKLLADEVGKEIPTHPADPNNLRYTLLMPFEFFGNKKDEAEKHQSNYADRFNLDFVSATSHEQYIDKIISLAKVRETKTIAMVSRDIPEEQLERLTKLGIRFIRVDTDKMLGDRSELRDSWKNFQENTYAIMLLVRHIDKEKHDKNSSTYRTLSFYLRTHFNLEEEASIENYIDAIMEGNISTLLKGLLYTSPMIPLEMPDYNNIAKVLLSA